MSELAASFGNVDEHGDVVDQVLLERLRERAGGTGAGDVDLDEHLRLVARTVARCRGGGPPAGGCGWVPGAGA